jgi:micrococcal nuclease
MTVTEYVVTDFSTNTTAIEGAETYPRASTSSDAEVLRVVDGDTIEVQLASGKIEDIRYIGIDTPETVYPGEPVECFGPAASRANERLVEGKNVRLVYDEERRDQYDRLLAYVYVGDLFVNARLVRDGFAYESYYSPNGAHRDLFERLQSQASSRDIGLWGRC